MRPVAVPSASGALSSATSASAVSHLSSSPPAARAALPPSVDAVDADGCSALMDACLRGDLPGVRWLLEHGATVNLRSGGWTALDFALVFRPGDVLLHATLSSAGATTGGASTEQREELRRRQEAREQQRHMKLADLSPIGSFAAASSSSSSSLRSPLHLPGLPPLESSSLTLDGARTLSMLLQADDEDATTDGLFSPMKRPARRSGNADDSDDEDDADTLRMPRPAIVRDHFSSPVASPAPAPSTPAFTLHSRSQPSTPPRKTAAASAAAAAANGSAPMWTPPPSGSKRHLTGNQRQEERKENSHHAQVETSPHLTPSHSGSGSTFYTAGGGHSPQPSSSPSRRVPLAMSMSANPWNFKAFGGGGGLSRTSSSSLSGSGSGSSANSGPGSLQRSGSGLMGSSLPRSHSQLQGGAGGSIGAAGFPRSSSNLKQDTTPRASFTDHLPPPQWPPSSASNLTISLATNASSSSHAQLVVQSRASSTSNAATTAGLPPPILPMPLPVPSSSPPTATAATAATAAAAYRGVLTNPREASFAEAVSETPSRIRSGGSSSIGKQPQPQPHQQQQQQLPKEILLTTTTAAMKKPSNPTPPLSEELSELSHHSHRSPASLATHASGGGSDAAPSFDSQYASGALSPFLSPTSLEHALVAHREAQARAAQDHATAGTPNGVLRPPATPSDVSISPQAPSDAAPAAASSTPDATSLGGVGLAMKLARSNSNTATASSHDTFALPPTTTSSRTAVISTMDGHRPSTAPRSTSSVEGVGCGGSSSVGGAPSESSTMSLRSLISFALDASSSTRGVDLGFRNAFLLGLGYFNKTPTTTTTSEVPLLTATAAYAAAAAAGADVPPSTRNGFGTFASEAASPRSSSSFRCIEQEAVAREILRELEKGLEWLAPIDGGSGVGELDGAHGPSDADATTSSGTPTAATTTTMVAGEQMPAPIGIRPQARVANHLHSPMAAATPTSTTATTSTLSPSASPSLGHSSPGGVGVCGALSPSSSAVTAWVASKLRILSVLKSWIRSYPKDFGNTRTTTTTTGALGQGDNQEQPPLQQITLAKSLADQLRTFPPAGWSRHPLLLAHLSGLSKLAASTVKSLVELDEQHETATRQRQADGSSAAFDPIVLTAVLKTKVHPASGRERLAALGHTGLRALVDLPVLELAGILHAWTLQRFADLGGPRSLLRHNKASRGIDSLEVPGRNQMKLSNQVSLWAASAFISAGASSHDLVPSSAGGSDLGDPTVCAMRLRALSKLIGVCVALLRVHGNFNACFEILIGLGMQPAHRLIVKLEKEQTSSTTTTSGSGGGLTEAERATLKRLQELMHSSANYLAYRTLYASTPGAPSALLRAIVFPGVVTPGASESTEMPEARVPYLGVLCKDLTALEEGGEGLISKVEPAGAEGARLTADECVERVLDTKVHFGKVRQITLLLFDAFRCLSSFSGSDVSSLARADQLSLFRTALDLALTEQELSVLSERIAPPTNRPNMNRTASLGQQASSPAAAAAAAAATAIRQRHPSMLIASSLPPPSDALLKATMSLSTTPLSGSTQSSGSSSFAPDSLTPTTAFGSLSSSVGSTS